MMLTLRPYQKECIEKVNSLPDGSRAIVALATGLGKTVVAANFETKGRILWLSHRDELVRQPEKYFAQRGLSYGIEKAGETSNGESVVSASVQSLYRDKRLKSFAPDAFDLVIVDEAQHAAAKTYRKILDYFKPRKLIGLTATPKRGDGVRLTDEFDSICFARDIRWGIRNHYLANIRCLRVQGGFSLDGVLMTEGDYSASGLQAAMKKAGNSAIVAKTYMDECVPKKLQTLIYCPTVAVCDDVAKEIKTRLPRGKKNTVAVLTGKTAPETRAKTLEKYQDGKINCIVNCMILTEGTDLPSTSCILNDRPTANESLYQQIIGRGTRLAEGKDKCLVIDIVNEDWREKNICTAPSLFGIDPNRLDDSTLLKISDGETDLLSVADEGNLPEIAGSDIRDYIEKNLRLRKQVVDIFAKVEEDNIREAFDRGGLSGVADDTARRLESDAGFGNLVMHTTPYEDKAYYVQADYQGRIYFSKPDMLGQVCISFDSIPDTTASSSPIPQQDAVSFVEDWLEVNRKPYAYLWSKKARSEKGGHVTDGQQRYISHLYGKSFGYSRVEEDIKGLSLMQACDLIDRKLSLDRMLDESKKIGKGLEDAAKDRKGRLLENWKSREEQRIQQQKELEACRKEVWPKLWEDRDRLHQKAQAARSLEDVVRLKREKELKGTLERVDSDTPRIWEVPLSYGYFRPEDIKRRASDKQRAFMESMLQNLAQMHTCFFEENALYSLSMPHMALALDVILYLKNNMQGPVLSNGNFYVFIAREIIDQVLDIRKPGQKKSIQLSEYVWTENHLKEKYDAVSQVEKPVAERTHPIPIPDAVNTPAPILPAGEYTVYTDGGCERNPGGRGGAACVIIGKGGVKKAYSEGYWSSTNNRMEIRAVMMALEKIAPGSGITLFSDSLYVLNCLSGKWRREKNQDLWKKLLPLAKRSKLTLRWVPGHKGDKYNEECDRMCTRAMHSPTLTDSGFAFA